MSLSDEQVKALYFGEGGFSDQQDAAQEIEWSRKEITRLTAELEQARAELREAKANEELWINNCNKTDQKRLEYFIRAEAAEQQVAVLVEAINAIEQRAADNQNDRETVHAIHTLAHKALAALPDRAKKIQAVLEAAKECFGYYGVRPYVIENKETP